MKTKKTKMNLDRWLRDQAAACRRTTKGRWRIASDAQGPCMVMHPTKNGVAIASLTIAHLPAHGMHEPAAGKPSPCPEAPDGTTYRPERVANARFIVDAHDSMPVALRLILAARNATDPGAAMQAALDEALEEQAARTPRRGRRKRKAAAAAVEGNLDNDDGPPAAGDDSDRAMFWHRDRMQAQDELARRKNIGRAKGAPEFAPCDDCGHVHNESSCPRCEGDGEEDLPGMNLLAPKPK